MTSQVTAPLLGREGALRVCKDALARAAAGDGRCVVVEGPAGIGKTRLLESVAAEATRLGVGVAAGAATEVDRVAPLATMLGVLRGYAPELALGALRGAEASALVRVDELRVALEERVRDEPLLVLVDDSQWADELTALALRVLVPALAFSPVLWVLARRPVPAPGASEAAEAAVDWLVDDGAHLVRLEPLGEEATAALAAHLLDAVPDPTVLALVDRSDGNPFLLQQLLTTLRVAGRLRFAGGRVSVVGDDLPVDFLDAVHRQLRVLPDLARALLDAGAVLGRPFTLHEVAGLLHRPAVELVAAATDAVAASALVERGDELAFRHDLVREAVYGALSAPVRSALHREAATVVLDEGRSKVEAAEHLVRGGRLGDGHAMAVLREAVAQVAPTAPGTAADLTLRMLHLLDDHDQDRPRTTAHAVRLLAAAGRVAEATELGERALRSGLDVADEAALLLGLAETSKHAGRNSAVVDYTGRALARDGLPETMRAQLLAVRAHGLLDAADLTPMDRAGAEAVELGTRSEQPDAAVFGLVARSIAARAGGRLQDAVGYARDAVRIADAAGGAASQRHPRLWLARALIATDQLTEAEAVCELGQREADHLGTAWSQPLWHYYRADLRMAAGRVDDARAEADAGFRVSEQLAAHALAVPLLGLLAQVAVIRDELDAADGYLRTADRLLASGVSAGPDGYAWRVALVQDAHDQPAAAVETLGDIYAGFPDRLLILSQDSTAGAYLVKIAQRAGATAQARATAAASQRLADLEPAVGSLAGAAAHTQGLAWGDLTALRRAVDAYRSSPRILARAMVLEDTALAESAAGHRTAGSDLLWEAFELYKSHGARRDAVRTAARLRRQGARHAADLDVHVADSWDTLTESELRVVRLVAEGRTNRETADQLFLSPHTVDSHLRHSFGKLGVNNRVELTRRALAHRGEGR